MKKMRFFTAKNIAYLAALTALIVVLQAALGTIAIGPVTLNFSLIPIVLGALLLGPLAGLFLGFVCGLIVLIQVITGLNPFYELIWAESPVVTTLTCLVKTMVAGWIAGWLYRLIAKKSKLGGVFAAAGIVPIVNTVLFILGMLCMSNVLSEGAAGAGTNVFVYILVYIVTFNFFIELAINLLLAPALHRVVLITERYIKGKTAGKNRTEPAQEAEPQTPDQTNQV